MARRQCEPAHWFNPGQFRFIQESATVGVFVAEPVDWTTAEVARADQRHPAGAVHEPADRGRLAFVW